MRDVVTQHGDATVVLESGGGSAAAGPMTSFAGGRVPEMSVRPNGPEFAPAREEPRKRSFGPLIGVTAGALVAGAVIVYVAVNSGPKTSEGVNGSEHEHVAETDQRAKMKAEVDVGTSQASVVPRPVAKSTPSEPDVADRAKPERSEGESAPTKAKKKRASTGVVAKPESPKKDDPAADVPGPTPPKGPTIKTAEEVYED